MPTGLLAHVVTAGPEVLGLPLWALAYGMAMVIVVVALWLRTTLVGIATDRPPHDLPATVGDGGVRRAMLMVCRGVSGIGLVLMLALAALGPPQQGANLAPLMLFSIFWVGGAWLTVATGSRGRSCSPFEWVARLRTRASGETAPSSDAGDESGRGWWLAVVVMFGFAFLWVADPDGGQPERIAWAVAAFGLCASIGAWRGGPEFLRRFDPFPIALSFTSWFRRDRPASPEATRLGVAAVVAGAAVFNRLRGTESFGEWVGPRDLHVAQLQNAITVIWLSAMLASLTWGLGKVTSRLAQPEGSAGGTPRSGGRPGLLLTPVLAAVAGALVLAQTLNTFLVQVQNFAILASDPLAKGWNLFGTINWRVETQPLGAAGAAWIQFALVAIGHAAAMVLLRDRCVEATGYGDGAARRAWRAMAPGTGVLALSGVGCTLGLLGS